MRFYFKKLFFLLFFISSFQFGFTEEKSQPKVWDWGPPLIYPDPFFYGNTTDLSKISVEFPYHSVTDVRAEDLTVNGSPATKVEKINDNVNDDVRYDFAGFTQPPFGKVEITLNSGQIKDEKTGIPFSGVTVTRFLFDPNADDDHDGLNNKDEIERLLDPTKDDSDSDGIPDNFEINYSCLSAINNEAAPQPNYVGETPGNPDFDGDGVSNVDEFKQGTDPCVADKK